MRKLKSKIKTYKDFLEVGDLVMTKYGAVKVIASNERIVTLDFSDTDADFGWAGKFNDVEFSKCWKVAQQPDPSTNCMSSYRVYDFT